MTVTYDACDPLTTFAKCPLATNDLPDLLNSLWDQQSHSWPALAEGIRALAEAQVRELPWHRTTIRLQFNPQRLASIQAPVDESAIARRRCPLCVEHLPDQQQAIEYGNEFLILCNPAPIFHRHFTVVHRRHRPQSLEPSLDVFLQLARSLSPDGIVFYNGPHCGASVPDHMHFQIAPSGILPIEAELSRSDRSSSAGIANGATVRAITGLMRGVVVLESKVTADLLAATRRCLRALAGRTESHGEPMINVLCRFDNGSWQLAVFPRKAHRPSFYYLAEPDRMLISPGTVDMAGLVVTAVQADFEKLDGSLLESVFRQVGYDDRWIAGLLAELAVEE